MADSIAGGAAERERDWLDRLLDGSHKSQPATRKIAGLAVDLEATEPSFDLDRLVPLTEQDDDLIRHITGAWVMIVRTNGGLTRRRCWLSATTAVRHARRAQELGHRAEIYQVELWPAWRLTGWESA
jgi:hypothetical protein